METSSKTKLNNHAFQRSISPSGRFCSSSISSSSSAFASSVSSFSSRTTGFFTRSGSPTRVNLFRSVSPSPSVRFSIDRPASPRRALSATPQHHHHHHSGKPLSGEGKTCMCSPTTHPGSFRCSLHKNVNQSHQKVTYHSNRLNTRRSAMTNSLVRIGTVEGDMVKRALAALIRPSSHQQKRRAEFQPRPSRLSRMSKAEYDR